MKVFILLPCYNEERALPLLCHKVKTMFEKDKQEYEIVIVNDGSSDRTLSISQSLSKEIPIHIIDHVVNKGLGKAMKNGLSYISETGSDEDVAIALDADNTHDPLLIRSMIRKMKVMNADVVIASRYAEAGKEVGLALHRKILSLGASTVLKTFFRIKGVRDYTCGYRAYSVPILKKAHNVFRDNFVEETGFVCMAEILIKLNLINAKIDEVGLVLRYDKKEGKSKMKIFKTINRYISLLSKSKRIITNNRLLVEKSLKGTA
ncbi:glycosyltransferase family 2 protein [Paenibacillus harenae]|uniref:glycosyltransferase family 2 protein n=1 Tax=Paenibacillus harenae TaxID=306543 RepID=UPI00040194A5|nr:glycosyltransferase family 2 protein [Paenibacillus harenae]